MIDSGSEWILNILSIAIDIIHLSILLFHSSETAGRRLSWQDIDEVLFQGRGVSVSISATVHRTQHIACYSARR